MPLATGAAGGAIAVPRPPSRYKGKGREVEGKGCEYGRGGRKEREGREGVGRNRKGKGGTEGEEREGIGEGRSGRGRAGRERGERARLGYLTRGTPSS